MNITLKVWRQEGPDSPGRFARYPAKDLRPEMSLLEALDTVNEGLVHAGERPIAFDSDCREGICGACGVVVNGMPHGPRARSTACELRLRAFPDGAEITLEPFVTGAFPLLRDLVVDRSALDRVVRAGGYVSVRTGSAPDANALPVAKRAAESALDAAACIGCGACVAACPNGSAALFVGAKLSHLGRLPQGQPEATRRALRLALAADREGFGGCTLHGECAEACPKGIGLDVIAFMNRATLAASLSDEAEDALQRLE
jgi:succinate dehydrogenase / fumarate reductase iron-sulfur subunit